MDYKAIAKYIIENGLYAGVRGLQEDEEYKVGDSCRESYEWDLELDCSTYDTDGEEGLTVGGTCATDVERNIMSEYTDDWEDEAYLNQVADAIKKAVELNEDYGVGPQVIIAGDDINNNIEADDHEVRIVDAKVIAIVGE